ncbi:MAG: biopolymer transporter ExbD [Candidatus Omnitrophota bacterium]
MRFRKHLELEKGQKEINITPLVDMVFLLLVFLCLLQVLLSCRE